MKIFVKAKPSAKTEKIEKIGNNEFVVAIKDPPIKGRANKAIIKALADHFKVSPSQVEILTGHAGKNKIIKIT